MAELDLIGLTLEDARTLIKTSLGEVPVIITETKSRRADITEASPCYVIRQQFRDGEIHLLIAYF